MDGPPTKRFAIYSNDELKQKAEAVQKKNTLKNEEKAERAFKAFLTESGVENNDFYTYTKSELDSHLAKFWFGARKAPKKTKKTSFMSKDTEADIDDNKYKVGSLYTMRHSLNRALKRYGHNFDITKKSSISFTKSIKAFEGAIAELKKEGKVFVENTPEVAQTGKVMNTLSTLGAQSRKTS